ncbi:hypothetical protein [uncultured Draconibacterium sp.]|uniref:hypothetical protein n=1 Tax=uncultured Draconibacterium sp. TaxID=1573823 RepID=UPI0025D7E7A4|nr:hypothetical protein [uncultured Draconibacterium sp.]
MLKTHGFFFSLVLLFIGVGCTNIKRGPVEEGTLEHGIYSSTYFNLAMNVPENWKVDTLGKVEKKATAADANESDITLVANLLTIYQEIEKEEFKPNLSMIAERCTLYPELKNENDYLAHVKKQYANLNPITSEIKKMVLKNAVDCYTFDLTMTIQEVTMQQTHFALKRNDFYIDITITYQIAKQKEELEAIVNSLTMN